MDCTGWLISMFSLGVAVGLSVTLMDRFLDKAPKRQVAAQTPTEDLARQPPDEDARARHGEAVRKHVDALVLAYRAQYGDGALYQLMTHRNWLTTPMNCEVPEDVYLRAQDLLTERK